MPKGKRGGGRPKGERTAKLRNVSARYTGWVKKVSCSDPAPYTNMGWTGNAKKNENKHRAVVYTEVYVQCDKVAEDMGRIIELRTVASSLVVFFV